MHYHDDIMKIDALDNHLWIPDVNKAKPDDDKLRLRGEVERQ